MFLLTFVDFGICSNLSQAFPLDVFIVSQILDFVKHFFLFFIFGLICFPQPCELIISDIGSIVKHFFYFFLIGLIAFPLSYIYSISYIFIIINRQNRQIMGKIFVYFADQFLLDKLLIVWYNGTPACASVAGGPQNYRNAFVYFDEKNRGVD